MGKILVINAGSSSIKAVLFDAELDPVMSATVAEIGPHATLTVGAEARDLAAGDHDQAIAALLEAFAKAGHRAESLAAAAHRVVHGGRDLVASCRIDAAVEAAIEANVPLAPLHNPANLAGIRALRRRAPDLPQFAAFDTAFHATNPEVATRYAVPKEIEAEGIRRYGFHGLSYASLVARLPKVSGATLPARLLAFHLGNGASLCAIRGGRSVATTMGYSPLDGLTMGTRSGGIDANAVLRLVEEHGLEATRAMLNRGSGLLGLSGGTSDMRRLMLDHTAANDFAVEHFCYWSLRHAGSLIAALEGLDAIAFTGGIGENASGVRGRILRGLEWVGVLTDPDANNANAARLHTAKSQVKVYVVKADEERVIAADAAALLARGAAA